MRKILFTPVLFLLLSCSGDGDKSQTFESPTTIDKCILGLDQIKIMPLGDSITEGERGHDTYRRGLWKKLVALNCSVDFVGSKSGVRDGLPLNNDFDTDHEGYWGYRIDQILPFIGARIGTYSPDMILIHLGSNDIFQEHSIESTISELSILLDTIRTQKPNVVIFLAEIIPSKRANDQITLLNIEIRKLGVEKNTRQSPLVIVDQNSDYLVADNYDGTHPAETGEVKMADKWINAILGHFGS